MVTLRPYQLELVEHVRAEYCAGARSVVMQLGTGGGKTATVAALIASSVAKGKRVVFAAHLDALIDDTSERLTAAGIEHGIVQADRPTNPTAPVQVASVANVLHVGTAGREERRMDQRENRPKGNRKMIDRYDRGAQTLADLEHAPFPDISGAIPELQLPPSLPPEQVSADEAGDDSSSESDDLSSRRVRGRTADPTVSKQFGPFFAVRGRENR